MIPRSLSGGDRGPSLLALQRTVFGFSAMDMVDFQPDLSKGRRGQRTTKRV